MATYPLEYELDIVLRDGGVASFRPIKSEDIDRLHEFFDLVGHESLYFRFLTAKKGLTTEELEHFTNLDYAARMAFVVLHKNKIIGVGQYDCIPDDPNTAEVAFLVQDDHQGRGIGIQLLHLLTSYARYQGITGFHAYVLPTNMNMLRVFRNSGYHLERTAEEGVYTVTFPVAYSQDARIAQEEREKRAIASSLVPIFYPRSIAVIGASRNPGAIGGRLFRNLLMQNFNGPIYPVNPNANVVHSVKAYRSVLDISDPVDLAFIVVPSKLVIPAVQECVEKGVRGLVVISAGFSEVGDDGKLLEQELLKVVRAAGVRMVGPNCMGLVNTDPNVRLNGTFIPVYPSRGNVAMFSQSGAIGIAILDYAQRNHIGISTFVSAGNKADISGNDLLLFWEDDPETDVILLYLESFGNPRRFGRIARRIGKRKPIVVVKSGRTIAGTRAAGSHTGALASLDIAVDALFNQAGVIRTNSLEGFIDMGALLANQPIPKGKRVGVITNAGGPGILAADSIEFFGLELPEFSKSFQNKLKKNLSPEASTRNPIDLTAAGGPDKYHHCLELMLTSDEVDAVIAIYIPTSDGGSDKITRAIIKAGKQHHGKKTILSVIMSSDGAANQLAIEEVRIPTYRFPEPAARALARAARYGEWRRKPEGEVPTFDDVDGKSARDLIKRALKRFAEKGGWLEPAEVEQVLRAVGIPVPKSFVANTEDEAVKAAKKIGSTAAMKVISPSIIHKTDIGGVVLNIEGEESVRSTFRKLMSVADNPEGVLVQEMISGDHEILIGMTEDPSFGPLIVFGLGGVLVELMSDVTFRIHPLTDIDAAEMINEIKSAKILHGYRSFPPGDIDALQEALLRVSALVESVPEIVEMDINPIKVLRPGEGIRAVDARIRVRSVKYGWSPELVDIPATVRRA